MRALVWLWGVGLLWSACTDSDTGPLVPAGGGAVDRPVVWGDGGGHGGDAPDDATVGGDGAALDSGPGAESHVADDADLPDPGEAASSEGDEVGVHCGSGAVRGRICAISSQTFVDGARVWVDAVDCEGALVHRETMTDADGFYTLDGVPNGLQTVFVERDTFARTYVVDIPAGGMSDVTGAAYKECFRANEPRVCAAGVDAIPVESKAVGGMVDIILFIDTSGSMDQETAWVKQNLNSFASIIGNANVDARVVLIGEAGGGLLCVPEPLAGPGCTDGPNFRHVHAKVGSDNGLEKVAEAYPIYKDFLRAGATTNFIAVTDDNSDKSASWFTSWVHAQIDPGFSSDWVFHSIVAMGDIPIFGCFGGAFAGLVYLQLSHQTGGSEFPVCDTDWTTMFEQLASSVVQTIEADCIYDLPTPSEVRDADKVSLAWHGPSGTAFITRRDDAQGCDPQGGWHLDDPVAPTRLVLCPASCDELTTGTLVLSRFCDP